MGNQPSADGSGPGIDPTRPMHPHSGQPQSSRSSQRPPHMAGHPQYNSSAYGAAQPGQRPGGMQQSSSDASMDSNSNQKYQSQSKSSAGGGSYSNQGNNMTPSPTHQIASVHDPIVQANIAQLSAVEDDVVPTVFRWEHGGRDVYITGTFNDWTRQIPMHRSGNDFTYIHNLKRGKHAFKFIVDDEWRYAPDQPTVADIDGRINNFIDVTDFKPYTGDKSFETEKTAAYYAHNGSAGGKVTHGHMNDNAMNDDDMGGTMTSADAQGGLQDPDGETFTHTMPDLDEYTKDPPPLPPHLRHIILNKPPQLQDTAALPVPQHVALNHLYCTAIRDNMMVLGITQRYQTKFVTTVYYSPELSRPI